MFDKIIGFEPKERSLSKPLFRLISSDAAPSKNAAQNSKNSTCSNSSVLVIRAGVAVIILATLVFRRQRRDRKNIMNENESFVMIGLDCNTTNYWNSHDRHI